MYEVKKTYFRQVYDSLLSVFPNRSTLAILVRLQLGPNLERITTGDNVSEIALKLIEWAEANGRVEDLISGMFEQAPDNPDVSRLFENSRVWFETTKSTAHKLALYATAKRSPFLFATASSGRTISATTVF